LLTDEEVCADSVGFTGVDEVSGVTLGFVGADEVEDGVGFTGEDTGLEEVLLGLMYVDQVDEELLDLAGTE
jgi:hypothetical protein